MNRIISFDYLRSIAVLGILLCHFCYNFDEVDWLGRFLGSTFNALFLCMSALLLGLNWHKKGCMQLGSDFLKHRFKKLSYSYYPFLVLMFAFLFLVAKHSIELKDVVMHLLYLPWFCKIEGFGHLWFMTMIAICYIIAILSSRFKTNNKWKWLIYSFLVLISLCLEYLLDQRGLPGMVCLYSTMFLFAFREAPNIVQLAKKGNSKIVLPISIIILLGIIYVFSQGIFNVSHTVAQLLGLISAFVCFMVILIVCNKAKDNQIVNWIASISFEIYLVHHVFAFGRFSVMNLTSNPFIGFTLLLIISVILATVLHQISLLVNRMLK